MSIICSACNMLTEPMGLHCEFCGKSPLIKNKKEYLDHLEQAKRHKLDKKISQLEELRSYYFD